MIKRYFFYAVGRKQTESSDIDKIEFLDLEIEIDPASLSPEDQHKLKCGFIHFLDEDYIHLAVLAKLEQLDDNDETITPLSALDIRKKFNIGPHDRLEPMQIAFEPKHRFNYCERFLPPVMKATLMVEFFLFIPLLAAAIGNSEEELFSFGDKITKSCGTTQSLLYTLYNVINTFAGPGANNLGEFGIVFDNALLSLWRSMTCKTPTRQNKVDTEEARHSRGKKWLAKGSITLFCMTYLLSDFLLNFQEFKSMEQRISVIAPFSVFNEKMIFYAMKINFFLNQVNDPIYASSFVAWSFNKINQYYKHHPETIIKIDEREEKKSPLLIPKTPTENLLNERLLKIAEDSNDEEIQDQPRRSWCCFFTRSASSRNQQMPDVNIARMRRNL